MSVSRMITGHELFRSLGFDEVARISDFSRPLSYKKRGIVFRHSDLGTHFYIVLEGCVNLKLPSADDESNLVVGRMEKGDIFGLSPLLGFERFTTTAECLEPSTILAIEIDPFRELLEKNLPVSVNVMSIIARAYFSRYIDTLRRFQNILNDLAVSMSK